MEPISTTTALIGAGASLLGSGANALATGSMNKKTREYNTEMYERQKADNLSHWHLQNDYNSPTAQMERLRSAGLNPNLVYGNGTVANNATTPDTGTPASWNPKTPEIAAMATNSIGAYQDVRLKQAQYDNLRAQNTVLTNDALLKASQTLESMEKASRAGFDNTLAYELRQNMVQLSNNSVMQSKESLDSQIYANRLEGRKQGMDFGSEVNTMLDNSYHGNRLNLEIQRAKAEIKNTEAGTRLRELETQLNEMGIQKNDPIYLRVLTRFLNDTKLGKKIQGYGSKF